MLAAQLYVDDGKKNKAAKVLESSFAADAHPALLKVYDDLYKDEDSQKHADRLRKLAAKNQTTHEAALLEARAYNLEGEWKKAAETLEPVVAGAPGPAAFSLMAAAAAGLQGEEASRPWLERAANAPRDPRPGAEGEFHFTREGWARLVREYMNHARLAPPPLEEAGFGAMSVDEVRLLMAPPLKEEPEIDAQEGDQGDGDEPAVLKTDPAEEASANEEDVQQQAEEPAPDAEADALKPTDDSDHIRNDEEAERAAAAAGKVS